MKGRTINTLILDFAGTIGDKYSMGPKIALTDTFTHDYKIQLTDKEVSVGNDKFKHIVEILRTPSVMEDTNL